MYCTPIYQPLSYSFRSTSTLVITLLLSVQMQMIYVEKQFLKSVSPRKITAQFNSDLDCFSTVTTNNEMTARITREEYDMHSDDMHQIYT